jgi:hypothetical protein
MLYQPATPYIYEMVEKSTAQTTVIDVLLGAAWVVGGLAALALVSGLVCAGALIVLRRVRGQGVFSGAGSDATKLGLGS